MVTTTVQVLEPLKLSYEIVITDDCSRDRTWELLKHLAAGDPRIAAVNAYVSDETQFVQIATSTGDVVTTPSTTRAPTRGWWPAPRLPRSSMSSRPACRP